jgi:hypothetical protein
MNSPPSLSGTADSVAASHDFDPQEEVVDAWGIRYPSFKAFLLGNAFEDDRCNGAVEALRNKGRSQAFCKTFAEGFRSFPRDEKAEKHAPPTFETQASKQGWRWAADEGYVDPQTERYRSLSWHNIRLGEGYDAARRAAEPAPAD